MSGGVNGGRDAPPPQTSSNFPSHLPKDSSPVNIESRGETKDVYLFPVQSSLIFHCLSVESHLSVTLCFLLKHFLKKISAPHVCLFFGQDGGREKYPLPTTPPRVPLVTFLLKCSINDTALMFYMPGLLIYLLSGCLFS